MNIGMGDDERSEIIIHINIPMNIKNIIIITPTGQYNLWGGGWVRVITCDYSHP